MSRSGNFRAWAAMAAAGLTVSACGGGGGAAVAPAGVAAAPQAPATGAATSTEQGIAEQLYAGTPRVPGDFYIDPPATGATGAVATTHLKNTDVGAAATVPRYELCTDDMVQALSWSESRATYLGAYSDLVETNSSARTWELVRVPRSDSTARLRQRVFKCGYLDRSGTDLGTESGPAGVLKELPVSAAGLRTAAEYLWQFTSFNNADHVVLKSSSASTAGDAIAHTIEMARLTRGTLAGECDRIDVLRWTHTATVATGALARRLETTQTFRAKRENGIVQICSG